MDTVKTQFSISTPTPLNGGFLVNKKWFSASDELKRKGGYTQYNESFGRIGKYIQASEVGRFHFYCAACEADFSLAKMGPRAVERHVQSTRHKKIVAALATNLQGLGNSETIGSFSTPENALASTSACSNRNMFFDMDTSSPMDIFDVRSSDSLSDPLQSLLQNAQIASSNAAETGNSSTGVENTAKCNENGARAGGTANIICGAEANLSLNVKKEVIVPDASQEDENNESPERSSPDGVQIVQASVSNAGLDAQQTAACLNSVPIRNAEPTVSRFLQQSLNRTFSGEKEQQLFLLKAEILQMKKKMMRLKCEYYRKKITLVEMMKQNNYCTS